MRAMARGAAILCADNQLGVDAIMPYTHKGRTLEPDRIGAVLLQFKDIAIFNKPSSIVAKMDSRDIGVFEKNYKGEVEFHCFYLHS